jgi:hypothetical protein
MANERGIEDGMHGLAVVGAALRAAAQAGALGLGVGVVHGAGYRIGLDRSKDPFSIFG